MYKKIIAFFFSSVAFFAMSVTVLAADKDIRNDFKWVYSQSEYEQVLADIADDEPYLKTKDLIQKSDKIPYKEYIFQADEFGNCTEEEWRKLFADNDREYQWVLPFGEASCTRVIHSDDRWRAYLYSTPVSEDAVPSCIDVAAFAKSYLGSKSDSVDIICVSIALKWSGIVCNDNGKITVIPYTVPNIIGYDAENGKEYSVDEVRLPIKAESDEIISKYNESGQVQYGNRPEVSQNDDTVVGTSDVVNENVKPVLNSEEKQTGEMNADTSAVGHKGRLPMICIISAVCIAVIIVGAVCIIKRRRKK